MIKDRIAALTDGRKPLLTRHRHISAVTQSLEALDRAEISLYDAPELMAEEFRLAASLGRISGCVDVEDLLDHIFTSFCIGK